jgi:outer membrane protein insertion porin family
MRWGLAKIAILVTAGLLVCQQSIRAQETVANSLPEIQSDSSCPLSSSTDDEPPSGPEISIADVIFSGVLQLPIPDQDQIAASVKEKTHGRSLDLVTDEALERVRAGWQDHGYFKVQVSGKEAAITSTSASQRVTLSAHIDEGAQYRLREITFENNKAISNVGVLRGMFPIEDGDVVSREKIATGLENLRKAYDELGYIKFTSIPNTTFDDDMRLISLDVDLDEGKQFRLSSVNVLGFDETSLQEILNDFPIGQVYNQRLFVLLLENYYPILRIPPDDPWRTWRHLDENAGTVAITLDARPCPE